MATIKIERFLLSVLFLLVVYADYLHGQGSSVQNELTVTAEISQASIPLNQILPFTVRVEWGGSPERYSITAVENPSVTNFAIVSSSASNRVEYRDGEQYSVRIYEFGLQPAELGMGYIESIIVEYTEGDSGATKRAMTQRLGVKITERIPEPGEETSLVYILIAAGAILVGVSGFYLRRRRGPAEKDGREEEVRLSPEEKTLGEMKRAREEVGDFREGIAQLTRLLNRYLSTKFDINAGALTIDDLIRTLSENGMDESEAEKLKDVSERTDTLKFSGQNVDRGTYEMIFADITQIIEKLKNGKKVAGSSDSET